MTRLKEMYQNTIMDNMMKKFGYKNVMQVPKLDKIVINMGVGEAKENPKALEGAVKDMEIIIHIIFQQKGKILTNGLIHHLMIFVKK